MFPLSELLVETPKYLNDTQRSRGYRIGEIAAGRRYTIETDESIHPSEIFSIVHSRPDDRNRPFAEGVAQRGDLSSALVEACQFGT